MLQSLTQTKMMVSPKQTVATWWLQTENMGAGGHSSIVLSGTTGKTIFVLACLIVRIFYHPNSTQEVATHQVK